MSNREAIEKIASKLASGELTPDYYIRQAIVTRYAENHGGLQLVGGVLVAVVGFSLVGWMGGVGIGLIAAQQMLNWHKQRSKDWEAIDSGKYAHLLTAAEAKHYERIYGKGSLQAAQQGDYSHAGFESDEAIDVPATPVEDAKKSEATEETSPAPAVATDVDVLVEGTSAGEAIEGEAVALAAPMDEATPNQTDGASPAQDDRFAWAQDLLHFPAVLIWGPQGSGKTSFAAWLLHQRIAAGHSARVFDPHASYGQWNGLKVIGAGMNFAGCDIAMQDFIAKVKTEYQARAKQPDYKPTRESLLVDEFTQWSAMCTHSSDFFVTALSDIRKIQKCVIFVSHDRSLVALGGSKGFSKARNNGLLELQLEAIIDPKTGEPRPAMKGKLRYPGKMAIEVEISTEMNGSMDFTSRVTQPIQPQPDVRDRLENLFRTSDMPRPQVESLQGNEEISTTPENEENQQESGFPALSKGEGNFHFEDFQLGKALFLAVKAEMENGKGKAAIVQEVLECPGRKYKYGCAWFDALMQKHSGP
jgi:hypothetical protein